MPLLSIGGNRPLPFADRAWMALVELWRWYREARRRAKFRSQLAECDDHLLRDMGLTRDSGYDPFSVDRSPWR
jgi:uncharacterized protein YjiS (DUF1127 family)